MLSFHLLTCLVPSGIVGVYLKHTSQATLIHSHAHNWDNYKSVLNLHLYAFLFQEGTRVPGVNTVQVHGETI